MYIDYNNQEKIDQIYIHDSIFDGYRYDYNKRKINLLCNNHYLAKKFIFEFNNVIASNMQSCFFWGKGNLIMCISLSDNNKQLQKMIEIQNANQNLYRGSYLDRQINYISIEIEINSGDTLVIICENFNFYEENLN